MITLIYRHRRENRAKCSLTPLENRKDLRFLTYPKDPLPDLTGYLVLQVGAPPLTLADKDKGLLLLDGTWKLAATMAKACPPLARISNSLSSDGVQNDASDSQRECEKYEPEARSLPSHFRTAYPRRQTACPDPGRGLSSIEALYLAYMILQRPVDGLFDHYHWKEEFLSINRLR